MSANLENLREKVTILENLEVPAPKITLLERQIEELAARNFELEEEVRSLKGIHNEIEADLLKAM